MKQKAILIAILIISNQCNQCNQHNQILVQTQPPGTSARKTHVHNMRHPVVAEQALKGALLQVE
jgi:hypothetical protein